jgi:hypothetical protein
METGEGEAGGIRFTHVMTVPLSSDIRDGFTDFGAPLNPDTVFVPDKNGTGFRVIFVERRSTGTTADHRRVYLDRMKPPTWPTNNL